METKNLMECKRGGDSMIGERTSLSLVMECSELHVYDQLLTQPTAQCDLSHCSNC